MKFKNLWLASLIGLTIVATSCDDDDNSGGDETVKQSVTLEGGPFNFIVDQNADNLAEDAITTKVKGDAKSNKGWIVTNTEGEILGLPPMPSAVNFNEAGVGVCYIWYIGYEDGLEGLAVGNNTSDISGDFILSNKVVVNRNVPMGGAVVTGGPFTFTVGDGMADKIPAGAVTVDKTNAIGSESTWVVTDEAGEKILGLPGMATGPDFDGAGEGICYLWYVSYNPGVTGLVMDGKVSEIDGTIYPSNPIKIIRNK